MLNLGTPHESKIEANEVSIQCFTATVVSGRLNVVKGLKRTNKSNCQFWKKSTYDWLVDNPSQDLFGQKPQ